MLKRSVLSRLVLALAAFKLALGLAALVVTYEIEAGHDPNFPYLLYGLCGGAFGLTALLLLLGGREDRRAQALGGFFLVIATAWCNKPLAQACACQGLNLFSLADALELDAFIAWFLWRFVRDFPQPPVSLPVRRRLQMAVRLSAAAGVLLFVLNLIQFIGRRVPLESGATWLQLSWLTPQRGKGLYYSVVLALTGAAFCLLLWRAARTIRGPEQRRARLFLLLLAFTLGPAIIEVLLELFAPGYHTSLIANQRRHLLTVVVTLLPTLTLPFTVPYAVLVHHVLDVRLVARRALQYLLARYSVLAVVAIPLVAFVAYFYFHRTQRLDKIISGTRVPLLLSVIVIGAAALHYRRRLLDTIDRRFFREQYDARRILTLLVDRIRSIQESAALANLVSREIDLALHLEGIALMVLDPRSGMLIDPRSRARKLDAGSALARTVSDASDPLEADLESPHSPLLKLPEKERHWLVDSGFRLLVPILARDGSLLGLVGLGEKKSGLPFLREDRELLHAIASSAAWVLELEQESGSVPPWPIGPGPMPEPMPPTELARECPNCGLLHPSYTVFCSSCSRKLEISRVPFVLPGKFRFERRVGIGGMGVVYQGSDMALGRQVAIKTLRSVSPEDAMRLRREARTAAAVSHPHLAPVYGMETWKGTPMLVMELLEGGTLAQRIFRQGLPAAETVELGIAMADALAQLHAADILHRDLKPSNIGYTRDGVPKLMDFGIARVIFELRDEEGLETEEPDLVPGVAVWQTSDAGDGSGDLRHRFVGTLSYLSPEALRGVPADASFDLWGLSVVLYECLLGRKVFSGTNEQVFERIRAGRVPDFAQVCPGQSPALAAFFRDALHRTPSRRPATAHDLRRRLEEVRASL